MDTEKYDNMSRHIKIIQINGHGVLAEIDGHLYAYVRIQNAVLIMEDKNKEPDIQYE